MTPFRTYCFKCEIHVMAFPILAGDELLSALKSDADVEVFHVSDNDGDHRWNLNREEKQHLLNRIKIGW